MIVGDRIRFRATERKEMKTFSNWFNDEEVRAGTSYILPMSETNQEKWFNNMLQKNKAEQPMSIDVKEKNNWKLIGYWSFFGIDWTSRSSEFGIAIGEKDYWNKGYGTEAVKLLINVGFDVHNFNRIQLTVVANNSGAIRAYEKVGFVHEGAKRDAVYHNGEYSNLLVMSILRDEWTR